MQKTSFLTPSANQVIPLIVTDTRVKPVFPHPSTSVAEGMINYDIAVFSSCQDRGGLFHYQDLYLNQYFVLTC